MFYKLSRYIVVTEPVEESGKRILFSTRTSKRMLVPQICWNFLEAGHIEDIPDPVLKKLANIKAIVPSEENELETIIKENKVAIDDGENRTLYEVIQPSAMCQLGCYYCGQTHTKDYMTEVIYEKMVERIRHKATKGSYKHLHIGWFGAEPLMGLKQMRELTRRFKEVAQEFDMKYSSKIVTNGLSLKEKIFEELAQSLAVTSIEVTLDGTAEYHDQHRYTKEGGQSFDLIFNNLEKILNREDYSEMGCKISIRCNVDEKNYRGVSPLIKKLADHGLHQKISHFYPVGVYSWGNDAHKKSLTKEEFAQREIGWLVELIRLGYNIGITPSRKKTVCMAVSKTSEMYDAFGNIFNCTETSYVDAYKDSDYIIGNLKDDPSTYKERNVITQWNDTVLNSKELPCHSCEMLPVCGGACPKSWHEDMRACPPSKFNMKDKLKLAYILSKPSKQELLDDLDNFKEEKELQATALA